MENIVNTVDNLVNLLAISDIYFVKVEVVGLSETVDVQSPAGCEVVDTSEVSSEDMRPTTEAHCPECDNDRAFWEMKQIRAADESETRFLTCTECGHKWREDDH